MKSKDAQSIIDQTSRMPTEVPVKYRRWVLDGNTVRQCVCGVPIYNHTSTFCSRKCSANAQTTKDARKQTNVNLFGGVSGRLPNEILQKRRENAAARYGEGIFHHNQAIENKTKIRQTNLSKYGVTSTLSDSTTKNKIKQTNLERYGSENPFGSVQIQEKIERTNIERYGTPRASSSVIVQEKIQRTSLEKYGTPFNSQKHFSKFALEKWNDLPWLIDQYVGLKKPVTQIADELNIGHSQLTLRYHSIGVDISRHNRSQGENELMEFVSSLCYSERSKRGIIGRQELDIWVPEKKLGIEYNGLYWHSDKYRDKHYHEEKTKKMNDLGLTLIQILDCEWRNKRAIVESRIRSQLGLSTKIMARKTTISQISSNEAKIFLNDNHIQGYVPSKISLGLSISDDLVAVMTFGKSRYDKKMEWELIRYCSKINTTVVGGASKLFRHFVKTHNPKSMISYQDKRYGTGNLYSKLGFQFSHNSGPNYHYTDYNSTFSRIGFQKHKLSKKLEKFDPALSEWANMQNNGWGRIWDAGNAVWHYFL